MTHARYFQYKDKKTPLYTPDNIISRSEINYKLTVILVVEGEDDPIALSGIIDNTTCNIVDLEGKKDVIVCLKKAHEKNKENIVGLVDSDYDKILQGMITTLPPFITRNLFVTDSHDINTMVAASNAFLKVMELNYTIRGTDTEAMMKIREYAVEITQKIGLVRCLSADRAFPKVRCNFKEDIRLDPPYIQQYIDVVNNTVKMDAILKALKKELTPMERIELENFILKEYSEKIKNKYTKVDLPWQLCQGHDLFSVLYTLLQKDGFKGYTFKEFSDMIFLQFSTEDLKVAGKNMHQRIKDWERKAAKAGKGYRILRASVA